MRRDSPASSVVSPDTDPLSRIGVGQVEEEEDDDAMRVGRWRRWAGDARKGEVVEMIKDEKVGEDGEGEVGIGDAWRMDETMSPIPMDDGDGDGDGEGDGDGDGDGGMGMEPAG